MSPPVFHPLVIAGLAIVISACQQQQSPPPSSSMDNSSAGQISQSEASRIPRPIAYFGDMFSGEEKALMSKPPEQASPTF